MNDSIIIAIWDYNQNVYSKSYLPEHLPDKLLLNGRKPNKIIIPESLSEKYIPQIKLLASYKASITTAKGR